MTIDTPIMLFLPFMSFAFDEIIYLEANKKKATKHPRKGAD